MGESDSSIETSVFLEHVFLPSKWSGSVFDEKRNERPLVGISGYGTEHFRKGKKNVWINAQLLGPSFIDNRGCVARSHIEGIVTDVGRLHMIETVYNFPACEGDCFEYELQASNLSKTPIVFEGIIAARTNRNKFQPLRVGTIYLETNPYWLAHRNGFQIGNGTSKNYSLPHHKRPSTVCGEYIPHFWNDFLKDIEEKGYDHPYCAKTEALKAERESK